MPHTPALLRFAFEHATDGMLLTDPQGHIKMVNEAFVRMFGYTQEEAVGQRTGFLRSESTTQQFYDSMWKSLRNYGEWKGEIVNRTKSGQEKICFLTISSIFSETGEHIGYLGVEVDLTERKDLENRIILGEKLIAIGESVATLVHEIRNPLNGISMNIQMLEMTADDPVEGAHWPEHERESIHLIRKEALRLQSLVTNVLDYSRKAELKYERVLVSQFLGELRELLTHEADRQNVQLNVQFSQDDITGRFDPEQMKQVMLNLGQNAIEAAEQSERRIVLVRAGEKEDPLWHSISPSGRVLFFEVANSGPAISEENRKNLFRPFFTTKTRGLGLGLATSAKIVRQHHGVLDLEPTGIQPFSTIFSVVLPS